MEIIVINELGGTEKSYQKQTAKIERERMNKLLWIKIGRERERNGMEEWKP